MADPAFLGRVTGPRVRRLGWIVLAWSVAALVAAGQATLRAKLGGGRLGFADALGRYLPILSLWAAATPLILWSARRWPVRGDRRTAHAAIHVVAGSAFVLALNLLIRVPILFRPGGDLAALGSSTLVGLATYYHLALIVYLAIVGIGHAIGRRGVGSLDDAAAPTGSAGSGAGDTGGPHAVGATRERGAGDAGGDHDRARADGAERLTLRASEGLQFVSSDEIDWIEADDNYVVVHAGARSIRARERLGDLEARLDPRDFVRIHRSAIVRISGVRELRPLSRGDHAVVLRDGTRLRLARSRGDALEAILGSGD